MRTYQTETGLVCITHSLPTLQARRYLNCCLTAGWHRNNALYHQFYPQGVDEVLVLLTVDGQGWIRIDGQVYSLPKGRLAVVAAHTMMEYGTDSTLPDPVWEFYWMNLDGYYVQDFATKLKEDGLVVHTCTHLKEYSLWFHSLMEETITTRQQEKVRSDQIHRICDGILMDCLFTEESHQDPRVDQILHYLQIHYAEELTLSQLSQQFYLSPNHLIRLFRQGTGYTPYEYIKHYRLIKAGEWLLTTTTPINEIARELGYRNQSHFSAQFHRLYGLTPREYRRMFDGSSGYCLLTF